MNSALYTALVGGTAAALWAVIIWVIQRIRNGPKQPEESRQPMARDQMIARLQEMAKDQEAPVAEREKAKARLDALTGSRQ